MRVLIVGLSWPPETFLARLIKGMADAGVEVTVACGERPGREWLSHPKFRWLWAPGWHVPVARRLLNLISLLFVGLVRDSATVRKILHLPAKSFPDCLHLWYKFLPFAGQIWDVTYFPWNSAAIEYLPLFDLGPPAVVSCRGSQVNVAPHDPSRHDMFRGLNITFQKAAAVHCVSEDIRAAASRYGLAPCKARVIHPAVDPDFFHPGDRTKSATESFNIITTGSLIWRKGFDYALIAVRLLLDQGIPTHFHIIGDGPEYSRLLYTIGDLHLEENVNLHGHLTPLEVRHRLQEADVFLLSSLSEGISNAVLEAMACGLPVVTTDCGGMTEAVTDGMEGLVVPVRNPEAMAAALARLASEPKLAHYLGQAARQRILKEFTIDRQIKKFIDLYQEAINSRQNNFTTKPH